MKAVAVRMFAAIRSIFRNKRMRGILQLLLGVVLLAWLISRIGVRSVLDALAGVDWSWYSLALLLFLLNVLIRSYRWYILLDALGERPPFGQLVYLYLVGFFFNNFIPSGFGGDVVKVISLRQERGRGTEALSSVIMDRLTGLIGTSLIALVALIWNGTLLWRGQGTDLGLPTEIIVAVALISLGVPLGFGLVRWADLTSPIFSRLPSIRRLSVTVKLQRLIETIRCYPLQILLRALLTSLPFTLVLAAIQYCIARAFSVDVPFRLFPLFVPIISVVNVLPLSFNGLGTRDGIYQLLFPPAGVSPESAMAMSLAFYFLRVGAGAIGGLLYAFKSIIGITTAARTNEADR
jgi:uncharacterized protein (TIRG00374 family)